MSNYDVIVIGAGPGGYVCAIRAAQLGLKVACLDKRATPGGTCLHVGCIPSKALLDSSEHYEACQKSLKRHGVIVGDVRLDLAAMLKRKDQVVKGLTQGVASLLKKNKVDYIQGAGKLAGAGKVEVTPAEGEAQTLAAPAIVLATGSDPVELPFLPFDGETVVSSTEALAFDAVPEHLVVVGAGFIGLELGSVWRRLGAKVTVVEFLPRILPSVDAEIADALFKILQRQGIAFHLDTKVTGAKTSGGKTVATLESGAGETQEIECDKILVSVGRRRVVENLGLEELGVKLDEKTKEIAVDEHFRTNVAGVYAIGDLIGGPMLAHKAEDEGVAVAELIAGKPGHVNYDAIPGVVYTWPEAAMVGLTEEQAKERGIEYRVGKFPFMANGRAKAMEEKDGFCKVIAAKDDDRVLGVHILGPRASDMIAEAVAVLEYGGSAEDIARTCHAHPTLSEALKEAALAVDSRALHM